jgi:hypothetical protein
MTARAKFDGAALAVILAQLTGSDTATALGLTAQSSSPILQLCRQLVAAGHDPALPLHAYRGQTLCLRIRSIGEAAGLEVNHRGTGFVARCEGRPAPAVAPNAPARTGHRARRVA